MKNLLFITWDGPQTSYMEGLFIPIFHEITKQNFEWKFHVIQFTWASENKTDGVKRLAHEYGIHYTSFSVSRKPVALVGSIYTLLQGMRFLKKYIQQHHIDVVMPRSTMPSIMVNRIPKKNFKILFDADGLAIEERVDFAGLSRTSKQYQFFTSEEQKMIQRADGVITRSHLAIDYFVEKVGNSIKNKFSVVYNGRDVHVFEPNAESKITTKKELGIPENYKVFVYCGSLGPQYGWNYMIAIFEKYLFYNPNAVFLIITGDVAFAQNNLPDTLRENCRIQSVPFAQVPPLLNIADVAFAIREPKPSMKGVAPIKLGEYLLMGIPTIASQGIGDTESILKEVSHCFLFDHTDVENIDKAVIFVSNTQASNRDAIRNVGIEYFSLEKSALSYQDAILTL